MTYSVGILSVSYSPDGYTIALGCADGAVLLLSSETGVKMGTLQAHTASVRSVAYSPHGTMISTGSDDGTVALWDAAILAKRVVFAGHAGSVLDVAWSPDGTMVAIASQVGPVRLFSTTTGKCLAMLLPLPDGWVALRGDSLHCRTGGEIRGAFWYAAGLCRFEPGELDPYLPAPFLLPEATALIERKP
jgi:WD40 repeat protein